MSRGHWMTLLARREGFAGADQLEFAPGATIDEVWERTCETCGVAPEQLAEAVASMFRLDVADFETAHPTATKLLSPDVARRFTVFPLEDHDRTLRVATADPTDVRAEHAIGFASGRTPRFLVAPPEIIRDAINATYLPDAAAESLLARADSEIGLVEVVEDEEPEAISADQGGTGPVVRLTNLILHDAVKRGSSDIHIQPTPAGGVVRFRVDGVLRTAMRMPLPVLTRVISRIKIMSRLDITDRLRPQDGRARILIDGKSYDLRISTVPTRSAEKAVIRILDPSQSGTLEDVGIQEGDLERLRGLLTARDGIFVVTGPTGSGKTTTMYAALREISTEDVNIMTVEDPVEYELSGLTQIQVEPKQGVTFASALRAILRQDPDVVFVGEIRDGETAEIAAQASLTGHLVLATLHTNDAVGAIRRFTDLGLDVGTLAETLRGALAQRLVRRLCPHCVAPVEEPLTPAEEKLSRVYRVRPIARAIGCPKCDDEGYLGRLPVTELMIATPDLMRVIMDRRPPFEVQDQARRDGMITLLESALERVRKGETTLEEVERVVGGPEAQIHAESAWSEVAPPPPAPRVPAAQEAAVARPAHEPPPSAPTSEAVDLDEAPAHVLVVDDDPDNRLLARSILESNGFRVSEAADGGEALVLLMKGMAFSLMILDLDMPKLSGQEVLRAVRDSVLTVGLPVIILTGSSDPDTEFRLMDEGADDYIRKPIEPRRFISRVRAALRRAGAAASPAAGDRA